MRRQLGWDGHSRGAALLLVAVALLLCLEGALPACIGGGEGECGRSGGEGGLERGRHLLQLGWTDATRVLDPLFVEWVEADSVPSFELPEPYRCSDRTDWTLQFPPPLEQGALRCPDYGRGGVNDGYCLYDEGFAHSASQWMMAKDACPRACGMCCSLYCASTDLAPDSECLTTCSAASDDQYTAYLMHLAINEPDPPFNFTKVLERYKLHVAGANDTEHSLSHALFEPVPFLGGEFLETKNVSMLVPTAGALVRYTTDG
ncbi:hypothetical protein T484DRAFT_1759830, partial [Baffinella frigidus]